MVVMSHMALVLNSQSEAAHMISENTIAISPSGVYDSSHASCTIHAVTHAVTHAHAHTHLETHTTQKEQEGEDDEEEGQEGRQEIRHI